MSKKAAKKAVTKGSESSSAPIATLVARLSREDLEDLVVRSVESGAVAQSALLALLPEAKQQLELPKPAAVGSGEARTGTGLFDDIDDEILVPCILARLDTKTRFVCAQTVCKSWRNLRDAADLWRDIDLTKYQFIPRTRSAEINPRPARPMLSHHLLFYDCR